VHVCFCPVRFIFFSAVVSDWLGLGSNSLLFFDGVGFVKASELTSTLTLNHESLRDVLEQLKRTPAGLDAMLAKMIPCGVSFHHAGMMCFTETFH